MLVHFLVEDISGERFLDIFMQKYINEEPSINIDYTIHSYKGIGGFLKGPNAKNTKSQQLLSDLPKRLKALNVALSNIPNSCVFIVLDNDTRNPDEFRAQLNQLLIDNNITIDNVFCVAIEEMEAWLLGDREALQQAYPNVADRIATKLQNYKQDSICGTWEKLADIITKGGLGKFKKENPSAYDIGCRKSEWAITIGQYINIRNNISPSFQYMLNALDQRRNNIA